MNSIKPITGIIILLCGLFLLLPDPPTVQASGFSSKISGGGFKSKTGKRSRSSSGGMSGVSGLDSGSSAGGSNHQKDAGLMYDHERKAIERQREEERRNRGRRRAPDPPPRPVAVPLPSGN